jgi:flagellar L-ring protein precursor FlgH
MMKGAIFQGFFLLFIGLGLLTSGCSTFNELLHPQEKTKASVVQTDSDGKPLVKFSDNPNLLSTQDRQYHRMTRSRMEEESQLQSNAGSMWVDEGQGAYYFAQNKMRREGDIMNVKLDGAAQKQVQTKVTVIKQLLKQLEEEEQKAKDLQNGPAVPALAENGEAAKTQASRAPASEPAKKEDKDEPLDVQNVPTRIVERMADGNYRVKGAQPFMIGKREYKVLVTGIIRPEDFNDDGVSSEKLLDPQYDVVSLRRSQQ